MIDAESLRLLRDLPDDIKARGWQFVVHGSSTLRSLAGTKYMAVYERPLDPDRDNERLVTTVHRKGQPFVHISTRSSSWDAAYLEAIQRMREVDAQCSRKR